MESRLLSIFNSLKSLKCLVVGDTILDKYVSGEVQRISPEAPIQILNVKNEEYRLGGAANVAANLIGLGAEVELIGVTGADKESRLLKKMLINKGLKTDGIIQDRSRPTTVKTRLIAKNQQMLRMDCEKTNPLKGVVLSKVLQTIRKKFEICDLAIISDYDKGCIMPEIVSLIVKMAGENSKKDRKLVIVDPKGRDYSKYRGVSGITPNQKEFEEVAGVEAKTNEDIRNGAMKLIQELYLDFIVVTLGEKGMMAFTSNGEEFYSASRARTVYDVTGAGDTALATLALCLGTKIDFADALRISNIAASIVVGRVGTYPITKNDIVKELTGNHYYGTNKIVNQSDISEIVYQHKLKNEKIVFTNGCFDILHPGHISTLRYSKSLGDILVVGVNSDESVRRLKNSNRPINKCEARCEVLSAIEDVDYVVVFNEETPLELIKKVKPDIIVKGGDWEVDEVVGKEFIESYGGRVEIAPYVEGFSTSGIIEKIIPTPRD